MRITRSFLHAPRRGTVLPMLGVCLIGLFGFTALAVDLGILAVSRTECQNGSDIAALIGCRTLNNKPTSVNNDLALAVQKARYAVTGNPSDLTHYPPNFNLNKSFTTSQIQKIEVGQYLYDSTTQKFRVATWYDVTNTQSTTPPSGSWTAIRVTIAVNQPTYFMKVFGVTTMPTGAIATAVYRPRDTAFVLDMTGSMAYASQFNYNGASMNPDDLIPMFGHYVSVQASLRATANQANTNGEAISRNNYTITTPGGLPIVKDFYYDTANASAPATVALPVVPANLKMAFHCIPTSKETAGDATTYTPPTYDFSAYNALDTTRTNGPTPGPTSFKTMTDSGTLLYVGDRYRRADGSINKTDTTWSTAAPSTKAAGTAIELLGYNVSGSNVRGGAAGTTNVTTSPTIANFRDLVWGQNGYDLNIVQYRTDKGNNSPLTPSPASSTTAGFTAESVVTGTYLVPLVPAADRFKGYSMGPGYWGKTFFIWPPDPRWGDGSATAPDPTNPGASGVKDANGRWIADWRRRFFLDRNSALFNPQNDNNSSTTGSGNIEGINEVLLSGAAGLTTANSTTNWLINYPAVLKWLKSGPQTLPPNLRAGRVLYYSSIPNDVNTATGTATEKLDKIFWKKYIDYVIGYGMGTGTSFLYGNADSWTGSARTISTADLATWTGPLGLWPSAKPYMPYNDSPNRPRLHMWFGPLSMMDFIGYANGSNTGNWLPGTCHEAQCWQLKAGVSSVIDDVRNNRPNDYVGMVMFAASLTSGAPTGYNGPRAEIGQNYNGLKNALFYPKSLLVSINGGNTTGEVRPYDVNFATTITQDEIPNANGSTDPNTGLAYAFNILSPSTLTSTNPATGSPQGYGTLKGRRGASKVVILETDGVPNTYSGLTSSTTTMNPTKKGYDTYYPAAAWTSGILANGDATTMSEAVKVVQQIVKPMATSGNAQGSTADSGLSLPNAPARVYPIGFGDLFDTALSPGATFRPSALQFLANLAAAGNTGVSGATTLPSLQIITGSYDQRISRLKDCLERIFETGVSVALIE